MQFAHVWRLSNFKFNLIFTSFDGDGKEKFQLEERQALEQQVPDALLWFVDLCREKEPQMELEGEGAGRVGGG